MKSRLWLGEGQPSKEKERERLLFLGLPHLNPLERQGGRELALIPHEGTWHGIVRKWKDENGGTSAKQ